MRNNPKRFIVALLIGAIALLLSACASNQKAESDSFFKDWRIKAESARGYSPKSEPVVSSSDQATTSSPQLHETPLAKEVPLPTVTITLTLHDTPVATVLRALAKAADQSIIISSSVEGMANINAVEMPWDSVFLGILKTYGLTYEHTGKILRISTLADLNKEWEQDKAELRRKELKRQMIEAEAFETKIFFIRYTDGAALGKVLNELMGQALQTTAAPSSGSEEAGATASTGTAQQPSITVDEANNAVIVHASLKTIRQIGDVIQELDRPTTQVLIEAQIVETSQDTARALGVQWGGLNYEEDGDKLNWIGGPMQNSGNLFTEDGQPVIHQPSIGNIINFPAELKTTAGATLGYQLQDLASNYILTAQLSALQEDGKLNILSSPSITTLDNQAASIESGREVPFQTVVGTGTGSSVSIEYKKAVLSLKVTPHTIDRKSLRLNVVTHKDELDFTNVVQGNPTIITKNAETNVILYDGQTMVIGGLSKETDGDSESGVPLLKDLPLLGHLFKSTGKNRNMEEVLIFITPHILKEKPE